MICPVVTFCLSSNFWLAFSQYQDELLAWQLEGSTWTELGLMLGTILLDQPWSDCICGKRKTILKHPQTNDTLSSFMQHNCIRLLNWWHGKTYVTNKTSFKNIRPRDAVMWLSKGSEVSFKQRVSWKISNAEIISLPSHKRMTAWLPTHSCIGKGGSPATFGKRVFFRTWLQEKEGGKAQHLCHWERNTKWSYFSPSSYQSVTSSTYNTTIKTVTTKSGNLHMWKLLNGLLKI